MKRVLCKKTIVYNNGNGDIILYKVGKYYDVINEIIEDYDRAFYIMGEFKNYHWCFYDRFYRVECWKDPKVYAAMMRTRIRWLLLKDWYFYDYFYSEQEERLLKLQRIDEKSFV